MRRRFDLLIYGAFSACLVYLGITKDSAFWYVAAPLLATWVVIYLFEE